MLVAHPSSCCDVCFQSFSDRRECYSIPCGHVFCYECLERLPQRICPMCRMPISMSRVRKVHVDMSKSFEQDPEMQRSLRKLEKALSSGALFSRVTLESVQDLAKKLHTFLRNQPPDQYTLLRSIEALLDQYSSVMVASYEESSSARAAKASYETRIKEMEEKTRQMKRLLRAQSAANNRAEIFAPPGRGVERDEDDAEPSKPRARRPAGSTIRVSHDPKLNIKISPRIDEKKHHRRRNLL